MIFSKRKIQQFFLDVFDMVSFLVFVGGIVLFIRFFIANPYTVVGASMAPTFEENDFIIVDKISPQLEKWERGDVIVFVPPGKDIPYIKRVIGLPGEIIKVQDGDILICPQATPEQCVVLDESYLPSDLSTDAKCGLDEFVVDDTGFFVLGDNRGFSTDSLCCFGLGCYDGDGYLVPYDHIIGKVYVRLFPGFSTF